MTAVIVLSKSIKDIRFIELINDNTMDPMQLYIDKAEMENPEWIHFLTDLTAEKINVGEEFRQKTIIRSC